MKIYPKEFQPFVSIILRNDDWIHALNEIKKNDTGAMDKIYSIESTFYRFFKNIRNGHYQLEGEMDNIKKVIREENWDK